MHPMFQQRPQHMAHYPDSMVGHPMPPIFLQGGPPPPHLMYNNYPLPYDMIANTIQRNKVHRKQSNHTNSMPNPRTRRTRRKSDSDLEQRANATYTGLDRSIADSFLEQQEKTQNNHHEKNVGTLNMNKGMDDKGSYNKYKDIQM
jgi:hypothetical protein